jgi:hypothetical protein
LLKITVDNLARDLAADQQAERAGAKWVATLTFLTRGAMPAVHVVQSGDTVFTQPITPRRFAGSPCGRRNRVLEYGSHADFPRGTRGVMIGVT